MELTDAFSAGWAATAENVATVRATLGCNVRRLREHRSATQEELAQRSSVGRDAIAKIERAREEPRFATLVRLAVALPASVLELLSGLPGRQPGLDDLDESLWLPFTVERSLGEVVAHNVRRERHRLGVSQKALAQAAGVTTSVVGHLESRKREPKIITLIPVGLALDAPLLFFLRGYPGPIIKAV
jgi:transcriptional regulator with XRE-family HTH domain